VDINLIGTMRVCAAARAGLKARGGCIVDTASMLSFFGGALVPGYSASKGGVAQLTKSRVAAASSTRRRCSASSAALWYQATAPAKAASRN
jgi:2-dehydro-3-deoxy-D-gluconate 5-dehydrogenase